MVRTTAASSLISFVFTTPCSLLLKTPLSKGLMNGQSLEIRSHPNPASYNSYSKLERTGRTPLRLLLRQDEFSHRNYRLLQQESSKQDSNFEQLATHMGYGTHYVDVYVGDPAQIQTLALSLTSLFTVFPCEGCEECGDRTNEFYNHLSSINTFQFLKCDGSADNSCTQEAHCIQNYNVCEISDIYLDGSSSWVALQAKDVFYIGGNLSDELEDPIGTDYATHYGFPLLFGCQTSVKGYFAANVADGIMSMGPTKYSFLNQMYNANKLPRRMFSLCFNPIVERVGDISEQAGAVTLGGTDADYHETPMVYAKSMRPDRSYSVHISKIFVRGGAKFNEDSQRTIPVNANYMHVNTNGRGVIIDSGTPYTNLDRGLEAGFRAAWKTVTGNEYSNDRFSLTDEQVRRFPTVLIQLRAHDDNFAIEDTDAVPGLVGSLDPSSPYDVLVSMPAMHYMEFSKTTGYYRSRLFFDHETGSVLGENFMQGHEISFDLDEHKIGFAEVHKCSKDHDGENEHNTSNGSVAEPGDNDSGLNSDTRYKPKMTTEDAHSISHSANKNEEAVLFGNEDESPGVPPAAVGSCVSATCRSFVLVGWAFLVTVAILLFVARNEQRKERDEAFNNMDRGSYSRTTLV